MAGELALPPISYRCTPLSCACTDHSQLSQALLSLSEVDCFCALLNENLLQSFNCILCFQKMLDFIENNLKQLQCFLFCRLFHNFITCIL